MYPRIAKLSEGKQAYLGTERLVGKSFVYIAILCCWLAMSTALAQEQAVLSFETATTELKTGQAVEIHFRLDNVAELWGADFQIHYDPALLYIMGTKSGSPIGPGTLFAPNAVVVRNVVQGDLLNYVISQLAPENPVSGSGVVGTFRIYPIAPGKTQLVFSKVSLTRLTFVQTEQGRVGTDPQPIPFTPVLLELNITGDPVEPPSEATATPRPTDTPALIPARATVTSEPTLVNVTAMPQTPVPLATLPLPVDEGDSSSSLMAVAVIVMAVGAVGLVIIGIAWLRSGRRR